MNQGEFFSSNEYNATSEYRHFPAEIYKKPLEENKCGNEGAELGREITTVQPGRKRARKGDGAKTLIDRIFGSIRGVATAATVAAASIAVATTVVTGAPQVELTELVRGDTYVEYKMVLTELDEDGEYAVVLSTSNEEDIEIPLDGDGTYENRIDGLKPEWEYTLSLVQLDSILGRISHFTTKFQTLKTANQQPIPPPDPDPDPEPIPPPSVQITGISIAGLDRIQIDFGYKDLPDGAQIRLDLVRGDLSTDQLTLSAKDLERGYALADMPTSDTVKVTPTVISGEVVTECEGYSHTFGATLSVQTMVCLCDGTVSFYPTGISNGAEYIHVTSSLAPDSPETVFLDDVVEVWYSTAAPITYTLYLTNEAGDVLSNEVTVSVDTSVEITAPEYNAGFPNPGDVCVTYNADGTVNLYIQTQFATDSEDLYYQITAGNIRYRSREDIARIENIPDDSYALKYDVCMDVNGVQYSIFRLVPSGMANEPRFYFDSSLNDGVLHLQLYKDAMHVDLDTVVLIVSGGDRIQLSASDFTYNEENGSYDVDVQIDPSVTEIVMQVMANPYSHGLEGVNSPIGNERKLIEETVYQI